MSKPTVNAQTIALIRMAVLALAAHDVDFNIHRKDDAADARASVSKEIMQALVQITSETPTVEVYKPRPVIRFLDLAIDGINYRTCCRVDELEQFGLQPLTTTETEEGAQNG